MKSNVKVSIRIFCLLVIIVIFGVMGLNYSYAAAPAPMILAFSASDTTVSAGTTVTLKYTTMNATDIEIIGLEKTPEWFNIESGSIEVWPLATTTYVLIARNQDGVSTSRTLTVNVDEVPGSNSAKINYFWASPSVIDEGETSKLYWDTVNTKRVEIIGLEKEPEALDTTGNLEVWPLATTTYVINAYGNDGTMKSKSVTINVKGTSLSPSPSPSNPSINSFSASSTNIELGATVTLSWDVKNATKVDLVGVEKDLEEVLPLKGSLEVWPMATTVYTLTAYGQNNTTVNKSITVNVKALPTPGQISYTVTYDLNDWGTGASANVKINNTGTQSINNWTLTWTFSGNQKITNIWGGKYTQSGQNVTVNGESWNSTIPVNSSVSFGFNISYSGSNAKPTNFTLK